MWRDPFTLIIAVGVDGTASGKLYLDDGDSFDYEQGLFVLREFKLTASGKRFTLSNHDLRSSGQSETQVAAYSPSRGPWAEGIAGVKIEQIIVLGLKSKPSSVTVGGTELEWFWEAGAAASTSSEGTASKLTVKNPAVKVVEDWSIIF
jgi:alpha 1,3-glucosidase